MKRIGWLLAVSITALTQTGWGAPVYQNQTNDTFLTAVYSVGPYDQIGDLVTLGGTERGLQSLTVQFFNLGSVGQFDASLAVWDATATTLLGTAQVTGIGIGDFSSTDVTFALSGLVVPDTISILLGVSNVGAGLDLGLNIFEPPTIGTSDNTFLLVQTGAVISQGSTPSGEGNLYLQIDASEVPEPSCWAMVGLGLAGLAWSKVRAA